MTSLASRVEPLEPPVEDAPRFLNRPGMVERTIVFATLFVYAWGTPPEWVDFATEGATESSLLTQGLFLAFFLHSIVTLNGNWHVAILRQGHECFSFSQQTHLQPIQHFHSVHKLLFSRISPPYSLVPFILDYIHWRVGHVVRPRAGQPRGMRIFVTTTVPSPIPRPWICVY